MITWKLLVYCSAISLLSNQVGSQSNDTAKDTAVFNIPASRLAQNLSMEFSNIMTNNLGVDALKQAFQGAGIFSRRTLSNAAVRSQINRTNLQEIYNGIFRLFNEAFVQSDQQIDAAGMLPQESITECCDITQLTALRSCCHQCQSQSEDVKNYLINVAGVFNNGILRLPDNSTIQVRFEFGHQSGALLEAPAINIGVRSDCTVRSAAMQDWYNSAVNSTTRVVIESIRTTEGVNFLSIVMASNGMVARALIKMIDLFNGLATLLEGRPSSYWLVLSTQGEIFYHPQLPFDRKVTINQLEQEFSYASLSGPLYRLESGEIQMSKTHLLPLGPTIMHGYAERSILSTYIYQPILMNATVNLVICVILAEEDRISATITPTSPQDIIGENTRMEPFYHCSFATGATNHDQCSYYCQSASRDALSVYLTSPSTPTGGGTSSELSTSVNLYLASGDGRPSWIQDGVATEAARASVALYPHWTGQSNTGINGAISWRYAAFMSGLLLNHPAVKIDKNLQFSHLPWYNRALANPGLITLSPATADPRRTGLIYSISQAIYVPRTSDSTTATDGPLLSVVAGDITLTSLQIIINSMEPLCTQKYYSCFLIDSAGIIIYHPSYLTGTPPREPRHFAISHPAFYRHLVSQSYVKKDRCNDYSNNAVNVSERSFSMFNVQFTNVVSNDGSSSCEKYQLVRIPDTNAFLAVEYSRNCNFGFCPCRPSALQNCATCPNRNPPLCDCPCTCHLTPNNAQNLVQCPIGPTERPPNYNFEVNAADDLRLCYNQECETITDQNSCNALRECTWCSTQCTRLADCCKDNQTTLLPDCIRSICRPITVSANDDDDVSSGAIAGAVVGVIFVILVIGCLILVLVWYNFIRKEDPNVPKQQNEFDFSKSRSSSDTQSQEPLSKKISNNKTDSKVEERDSSGANIVTPDTIQLSNPLYVNDNKAEQPQPPPPETNL